jgi:ATP-binding cassette, subfamily C, bacteriocin exporter
MKSFKPSKKNFILQKDQADCGVACLQNILRYTGADISLERLRELSGTNSFGTTLLGLSQAAREIGFNAQGAQANTIDDLKEIKFPCILHTAIENFEHYIVFYDWNGRRFLLGDPGKGLIEMTEEELSITWKSKVVLLLQSSEQLEGHKQRYRNRWQWLFLIAKNYTTPLVITVFMGFIISLLSLSTAIFSQKLVDRLLNNPDITKLYVSLGLLALLLFLKCIMNYMRGYILALQAKSFNMDITTSFYQKLLQMPKLFFDNRKAGDMVTRLNDTNRIQQTVSVLVGDVSIQILLLVISLVFIFLYSFIAGAIALIFIPVVFLLVMRFQPEVLDCQRNTMVAYARNESNYIDNINAVGIIKLFNKEVYFFERAKNIFIRLQEAVFNMSKIRIRFNLAIDLLATTFLIILIVSGVILVLKKQLAAGELIAILQLGIMLISAAITVVLTNIQIQEAKLAFDRMYEFVQNETPETVSTSVETSGTRGSEVCSNFEILEVEDLRFQFAGRKHLLKGLTFFAKKGEIVAITGESGQGKSTIFQLLQRFYKYETGVILVNSKNLLELDIIQWRKNVGVVTQYSVLFSGTILENILLKELNGSDIQKVVSFCRTTGLHEYFVNLPQGYSTIVGEGGIAISGGQKQLICLARCLFHQPQLLLLDEPTASMDKKMETFIIGLLKQLKSQSCIILISHKDALTEIADRTYKLENGILYQREEVPASVIYNKLIGLTI